MELYKKYRPCKLSELVGQQEVVDLIKSFKRDGVPQCLLLHGPSGVGKTTVARILKRLLGCSDIDFTELNCAGDARGIDTVREISLQVPASPIGGKVRMWLLDECAKLTSDAQTALLKVLEDTPPHVYFVLCTTDPDKVIPTIRTRCTEIRFRPLKDTDLETLVKRVVNAESLTSQVDQEVIESIVNASEGSARKALVLLNQVVGVKDKNQQLAVVQVGVANRKAIELARLLFAKKVWWRDVAKCLRELDEDPESVRRLVLAYAQTILLSGDTNAHWAWRVIDIFRDSVIWCGKPGLSAMCWELVNLEGAKNESMGKSTG